MTCMGPLCKVWFQSKSVCTMCKQINESLSQRDELDHTRMYIRSIQDESCQFSIIKSITCFIHRFSKHWVLGDDPRSKNA